MEAGGRVRKSWIYWAEPVFAVVTKLKQMRKSCNFSGENRQMTQKARGAEREFFRFASCKNGFHRVKCPYCELCVNSV